MQRAGFFSASTVILFSHESTVHMVFESLAFPLVSSPSDVCICFLWESLSAEFCSKFSGTRSMVLVFWGPLYFTWLLIFALALTPHVELRPLEQTHSLFYSLIFPLFPYCWASIPCCLHQPQSLAALWLSRSISLGSPVVFFCVLCFIPPPMNSRIHLITEHSRIMFYKAYETLMYRFRFFGSLALWSHCFPLPFFFFRDFYHKFPLPMSSFIEFH